MNIGIFGGSFDPVHRAHIEIAELFIAKFNLDKCFLVPCNVSPFKEADHLHPIDNMDRLEMLKIAAKNERLEISDFELNKGGTSYTIDTILHFSSIFPDAKLYLMVGRDQASEFVRWKDFRKIASIATIVIANRYEGSCSLSLAELIDRLGEYDIYPKLLGNRDMLDSSTVIRFRIHQGLPLGEFLDDDVLKYIRNKKQYT